MIVAEQLESSTIQKRQIDARENKPSGWFPLFLVTDLDSPTSSYLVDLFALSVCFRFCLREMFIHTLQLTAESWASRHVYVTVRPCLGFRGFFGSESIREWARLSWSANWFCCSKFNNSGTCELYGFGNNLSIG